MSYLRPLPNDKILDWFKLRAFAEDKISMSEKLKFVLGRIENIVGKGENAGYHHFLLFSQCFQNLSYLRAIKTWDCMGSLSVCPYASSPVDL